MKFNEFFFHSFIFFGAFNFGKSFFFHQKLFLVVCEKKSAWAHCNNLVIGMLCGSETQENFTWITPKPNELCEREKNGQMLTSKAHICLCPPIILLCVMLFLFLIFVEKKILAKKSFLCISDSSRMRQAMLFLKCQCDKKKKIPLFKWNNNSTKINTNKASNIRLKIEMVNI